MAATKDLGTPTDAEPLYTDVFNGTAGAEELRKLQVSKATASIVLTVYESGGKIPMAFYIQGRGTDGAPKGQAIRYPAGGYYTRSAAPEDPARGHVSGGPWTFLVAGENADCEIQVVSDYSGCP